MLCLDINIIYYNELKKKSFTMNVLYHNLGKKTEPISLSISFLHLFQKLALWTPTTSANGTFIVFRNTVVPMHMANCRYWSINVLECSPLITDCGDRLFRYLQCLQVFTGRTELHLLTELPGLHDLIDFFPFLLYFFHSLPAFLDKENSHTNDWHLNSCLIMCFWENLNQELWVHNGKLTQECTHI